MKKLYHRQLVYYLGQVNQTIRQLKVQDICRAPAGALQISLALDQQALAPSTGGNIDLQRLLDGLKPELADPKKARLFDKNPLRYIYGYLNRTGLRFLGGYGDGDLELGLRRLFSMPKKQKYGEK